MLKGIDPIFNPELLCALAQMGHSDMLAIVDENYPAYAASRPVAHVHGVTSTEFLAKLCALFPIDNFVDDPIGYMRDPRSSGPNRVQQEFLTIAEEAEHRTVGASAVERTDFYARARAASVIIVTSEPRPFGCFFVAKGVWPPIDLPTES
jgi:L-fucose mutarotase